MSNPIAFLFSPFNSRTLLSRSHGHLSHHRIREFIKSEGLDIKASGKGRTKAVILKEVLAAIGGGAAPTEKPAAAPAPEPAAAEAAAEPAAAADSNAGVEIVGERPPEGFSWGGSF